MKPIATFLDGERVIIQTRTYRQRAIICGHVYAPDNTLRYVVAYPFDVGWALHIYPPSCIRMDFDAPSDDRIDTALDPVPNTASVNRT